VKELINETDIAQRVSELGKQINDDYKDKDLVLVGVLKGAFVFLSDLLRHLDIPVAVDFLSISSYNGTESSGVVRLTHDLSLNIEGRDVVIVEDVVDTGKTLQYIIDNLKTRKPRSLAVCTLLNKKEHRAIDVSLDYVGFTIPGVFVVGYGLDYRNQYRNVRYIGVLNGR
jgi:hypoxanthine phosphoribosyltransferase